MQAEQPRPNGDRMPRISEDWAATILGLALIALAMLGVITKALVP
jgi:hypothetical protein